MMKKALTVTLGTVLAANMAAAIAHDSTSFLDRTAVHVNGTYTRAMQNGLAYANVLQQPAPAGALSPNEGMRRHLFVDQNNRWDWGAGLTHRFAHSPTRLFFHYDHFNDGTQTGGAGSVTVLGSEVVSASASVQDRSQEFMLGLDRQVHLGQQFSLDMAAFLGWDKVKQDFRITTTGPAILVDTHNEMNGFGPGVGIKGRATPFAQCREIGFFMTAMTSLLYAKNQYTQARYDGGVLQYFYDPEDTRSMVGKLDMTFGVDYKSPTKFRLYRDQIGVGFSLGMRYLNYINAFKNGNSEVDPLVGLTLNGGQPTDWGRIGPFLQVRLGGPNA